MNEIASPSDRFDAILHEMTSRFRVPGAAAAVVHDQEVVWAAGAGYADLDTGRRAGPDTLFRCASVTKPFTATSIMMLRDAGRLSLDDPLVSHVPEFAAVWNPFGPIEQITLRRLISHHSGLQSEAPFDYWDTLAFPSIEEILEALPAVSVALRPDSAFKYCNLGFILLGEVVARRSGMPYHEFVLSKILRPLGMTRSGHIPTPPLRKAMATGYEPDRHSDRPAVAPHTLLNGRMAAGGLYSTAHDLTRWLSLQFRTTRHADGGRQVISGTTLLEMQRPLYVSPAWDTAYCVSWHALVRPGATLHYHGGGLPAFSTFTAFDRARRVGAVVLTNLGGHDGAREAAIALIDATAEASRAREAPAWEAVPEELKPFLGPYVGRGAQKAVIVWRDSRLMLLPPPGEATRFGPATLSPGSEPDTLVVEGGRGGGELARFRRDERGRIFEFRLAATVYRKLEVPAG